MYCTCGCGKELGVETFHYAKKDGAFYSEDCMDRFFRLKYSPMSTSEKEMKEWMDIVNKDNKK